MLMEQLPSQVKENLRIFARERIRTMTIPTYVINSLQALCEPLFIALIKSREYQLPYSDDNQVCGILDPRWITTSNTRWLN
jgi:hypothetical protein